MQVDGCQISEKDFQNSGDKVVGSMGVNEHLPEDTNDERQAFSKR